MSHRSSVIMEQEHPLFSSCLSLLSSKNDSEKLAALLLATKLNGLTPDHHSQLFDAIGHKFLLRLMRSRQNPEGNKLKGRRWMFLVHYVHGHGIAAYFVFGNHHKSIHCIIQVLIFHAVIAQPSSMLFAVPPQVYCATLLSVPNLTSFV